VGGTAKPRDGHGRFAPRAAKPQEPSAPTEEKRDDSAEPQSGGDVQPRRLIIRPAASSDGQGSPPKSSADQPNPAPRRPAKSSADRAGLAPRKAAKRKDKPAELPQGEKPRAKPQQVVVPRWKVLLRQLTK
jgi:hypothetical protein